MFNFSLQCENVLTTLGNFSVEQHGFGEARSPQSLWPGKAERWPEASAGPSSSLSGHGAGMGWTCVQFFLKCFRRRSLSALTSNPI